MIMGYLAFLAKLFSFLCLATAVYYSWKDDYARATFYVSLATFLYMQASA